MKTGRQETVIAVLMAAAVVVLPAAARGAVLGVPGQYGTIQAAVNSARPGDTVQVARGTYREKLYIIDRADLTIAGAGSSVTLVVGRYNPSNDVPAVYVKNSSGIRISGIGFEGGDTGVVVTRGSEVTVSSCSIRNFHNVGVFVGEIPCSPLPPGSLRVPDCYKEDRLRHVDDSRAEVYGSDVSANGVDGVCGTGLVYFPGTSGYVGNSTVNGNKLTGIFVWGAQVDLAGNTLSNNIENALEYRRYPSPKTRRGFTLRAGGSLAGNAIVNTKPLPGNLIGGGIVSQGTDMDLFDNWIEGNWAWGISACRNSHLVLGGNSIVGNGKAGVIVQKRSSALFQGGDVISGNGDEGLVGQGGCLVEMNSSVVENNRRFGVLLQKRTEGHLDGVAIRGNGTATGYYGGAAFFRKSWGSVAGSEIRNHANGPGIHYYGSPYELTVEGSTLGGNRRSGIVFDGLNAVGVVLGNSFERGNNPYDVTCPDGGSPSLLGQPEGTVDERCFGAP